MKKNIIIIALVSFFVYFPSLFFGFTYFDDQTLVLDNINYLKNWYNIFDAFGREVFHVWGGGAGYYRPILTWSFIWDAQWGGASPFFYHLTNVFLHVAASCLIYFVLVEILTNTNQYYQILSNTNKKSNNLTIQQFNNRLPFFLTLFFAVHPILVQAVSWIPGRNDSLLGVFILLSFLFFLKVQKRANPDDAISSTFYVLSSKFSLWHLFFFSLALFTKETALVYPFLLCMAVWALKINGRGVKLLLTGDFLLASMFFLVKKIVVGNVALGFGVVEIARDVLRNMPACFMYIEKIFLPLRLSVLPTLEDANLISGIIISIFLLAIIFISVFIRSKSVGIQVPNRKNNLMIVSCNYRLIIFGASWFLAFLLPSFLRPNQVIAADFLEHRVYTSMLGILLVINEMFSYWQSHFSRKVISAIFILIVIFFSWQTFFHQFPFRDRLAFWTQAVADAPHSPLAHKNLGAMEYLDNNLINAEKEFQEAIKLNPQETIVHNNLGLIQAHSGKYKQAEKEYKQEIKINPTYDNVYYNYGLLKYQMKEKSAAEKLWQKTVEINPGFIDAWRALVVLATEQKDEQKAEQYLREARKIGLNL